MMNRLQKLKTISLGFMTLFMLSSCQSLSTGSQSSLNTYQNDNHLVRFRYPLQYRVEEMEKPGKNLSVTLTQQSDPVANLTTHSPGMKATFLAKATPSTYRPFTLGDQQGAAFLLPAQGSFSINDSSAMVVVEHNQKLYVIQARPDIFSTITDSFRFLIPSS